MTEQELRDLLHEADGLFFAVTQGTIDTDEIAKWRANYAAAVATDVEE